MSVYRCLSIRQPWVWGIFFAGKPVENRDWPTKVRGRVLIHASAGMTRDEYDGFVETIEAIRLREPFPTALTLPAFDELPRGCLFGGVTITDCVTDHSSLWFFGQYGFVLENPKPLPRPIPYKGKLGFFPVPAEVLHLAPPHTGGEALSRPERRGDSLPAWASGMEPVDMNAAAGLLGISRRTLVDVIKVHRHYERRGARKVFYPENILALREALRCQDSRSSGGAGLLTPSVPLPGSAFVKALELASQGGRKSSGRTSKPSSGNVIPMASRPSARSRKLLSPT